jgi:hypothetical protein
VGFDGHMIYHHGCRACKVRWELVSRTKCSESRTGDRQRGRAFALEASWFARHRFLNALEASLVSSL